MHSKALELRDRGTFIPILCVDMNPAATIVGIHDAKTKDPKYEAQRYLLRRCGYACSGEPNIIITRLDGNGKASNDPYDWGDRTFKVAHNFIIDNWSELRDGDVVDVEFILKETATKKISERLTT